MNTKIYSTEELMYFMHEHYDVLKDKNKNAWNYVKNAFDSLDDNMVLIDNKYYTKDKDKVKFLYNNIHELNIYLLRIARKYLEN